MRPQLKAAIPRLLRITAERLGRLALPTMVEGELPFRFPAQTPRSERAEAVRAVVTVMLGRTDLLTGRVGRPRPGGRRLDGLSIDHDLAPLAEISESRTERVIATLTDWGWLHYREVPAGRRLSRSGKLRLAAQPIERRGPGVFRGQAAVRVWTPAFWAALGLTAALAEAQHARYIADRKMASVGELPVRQLVRQLADGLSAPDPHRRPP